jgi:hypothetical protein
MGRDKLSVLIRNNHLHVLRYRILHALELIYPEWMDEVEIAGSLKGPEGRQLILKEMNYLAEKNLIILEPTFEDHSRARLTARGRDFLAGDVEEVGIMFPTE